MWKYPDGTYRASAPAKVEHGGFIRSFHDLTREQWDELGYNEAVPLKREPFTEYVTTWAKGADLICREVAASEVVDEAAKTAHEAGVVRAERDRMLRESDWTQVADSPLSDGEKLVWAEYRRELRNVPQQAGFPGAAQWPLPPAETAAGNAL